MTRLKITLYSSLVLSLNTFIVKSQSPPLVDFTGQIGLSYDAYGYSEENYPGFRPRYPDNLLRFSAHATLSAGKYFSMPLGIDITNQKSSYYLPTLPEERFIDYIQNPRNNISLNPTYKWAKAFLGTQTPSYSPLTTGDIPVFGLGIELTPGSFLFSLNYGKSQIGITPSPFENIAGAYEQWLLASRIGVGKEDGTKFVMQFVKLTDEVNSISANPNQLQAQEAITIAPLLQIRLSKQWLFSTELATSVYTEDVLGPGNASDNEIISLAENLITINGTSHADISNISALEWKTDAASITGEVRYVGAGFQSVGYRTTERDLIDYNLKTNFKLFKNKVIFTGSTGVRTNNLENTTLESTNRFIANINLYTQLSKVVSVNTSYSNFGFKNNVIFDTLKVEMIQNMFSIAPSLQFDRKSVNHIVTTSGSFQFFDEYNMFDGKTVSTVSKTLNMGYNLIFKDFPLSTGVMGLLLDNETPQSQLNLYNIGMNARYRLLDKKLSPSIMLAYSGIKRNDETPDKRTRLTLKTNYKLTKKLNFRLSYRWSHYKYGSARPDAKTNEHRLQFSVAQRF
ncbi:hypothetical protein SAMN06265379_101280 [Saccharicrinis carchari]|uniref:Uncharacterized protein n=1 Tax=Saccharicrinis carchari TaxID=1168039 RepID=A0A521ANK4_SACCC|nr:hypothetical protein [Saccharicrinis carchari]SMO36414.1 hypothetical protein SAMN06265379_101280 [Saccharicrinis carchari]